MDMLNMIAIIVLFTVIFSALALACLVEEIAATEQFHMEGVAHFMAMFAFLGDYSFCKALLDTMRRLEMDMYGTILVICFVALNLLLIMFTLGQFAMAIIGDAFTEEKEKAADFPSILNNVELIPMRLLRERLRPELFGGDLQWPKVYLVQRLVLHMTNLQRKEKRRQQRKADIQAASEKDDARSCLREISERGSSIVDRHGFKWDPELIRMLHCRNLTLQEVDTEAFKAMQGEYLELQGEKESEVMLLKMQQELLQNAQKQQEQMAK
eukprot:gene14940-17657_t